MPIQIKFDSSGEVKPARAGSRSRTPRAVLSAKMPVGIAMTPVGAITRDYILKAKSKQHLVNGLMRAGSGFKFVPTSTCPRIFVYLTRWNRPNRPSGPKMGGSLPGYGVGKLFSDSLMHRWLLSIKGGHENPGPGVLLIGTWAQPVSCRSLGNALSKKIRPAGLATTGIKDYLTDGMGIVTSLASAAS